MDEAEELARKLKKNQFDLEDFLKQLRQISKMGPVENLLKMIPGAGKALKGVSIDPKELKRVEAIILSMTPDERRRPKILNASRRRRIAAGSGTKVQDVNRLLNQFKDMQKMMKRMGGMSGKGKKAKMRGGMPPNFPGLPG
jgi:signal recognition particle subunit SRP54